MQDLPRRCVELVGLMRRFHVVGEQIHEREHDGRGTEDGCVAPEFLRRRLAVQRCEFALQKIDRGLRRRLRGEERQNIGRIAVIAQTAIGDRQRRCAAAEIVYVERAQRRFAGADDGEPFRQFIEVARAALRGSTAPERALAFDDDGAGLVACRQQLCFGEHRIGAHAGLGQTIDPHLHRFARNDGDGHAFGRQPFRKREMHFFDRRYELIFQRERHGPGELRALIRHARRIEQQHVARPARRRRCAAPARSPAPAAHRCSPPRRGRSRPATATTGRHRDEVGPGDVRTLAARDRHSLHSSGQQSRNR